MLNSNNISFFKFAQVKNNYNKYLFLKNVHQLLKINKLFLNFDLPAQISENYKYKKEFLDSLKKKIYILPKIFTTKKFKLNRNKIKLARINYTRNNQIFYFIKLLVFFCFFRDKNVDNYCSKDSTFINYKNFDKFGNYSKNFKNLDNLFFFSESSIFLKLIQFKLNVNFLSGIKNLKLNKKISGDWLSFLNII